MRGWRRGLCSTTGSTALRRRIAQTRIWSTLFFPSEVCFFFQRVPLALLEWHNRSVSRVYKKMSFDLTRVCRRACHQCAAVAHDRVNAAACCRPRPRPVFVRTAAPHIDARLDGSLVSQTAESMAHWYSFHSLIHSSSSRVSVVAS
jgi:hypothetical protein